MSPFRRALKHRGMADSELCSLHSRPSAAAHVIATAHGTFPQHRGEHQLDLLQWWKQFCLCL